MTKIVLFLNISGDSIDFVVSDRHNKSLPYTLECRNQVTTMTFDIEMPNLLTLELTNKNINLPFNVELTGIELGLIKFNQKRLIELCQFYPRNSNDRCFATSWFEEGKVQIELFDLDPIRFHLHWESTI